LSKVKRYEDLPVAPAAMELRLPVRTGLWRTSKPILNQGLCVACGICWMYCPERAVEKDEEGGYSIDYDYCKGCGICAEECPRGAIEMLEEGGG
jgi:pyruvate ferredoxin oxidoreductase delta subunit